jgi:homoserine/homoserine lactone efflux protein
MTLGFRPALVGVLAILTQATLFLLLSAFGVTALIATSRTAFTAAKLIGAGVLIYLGIRGWVMAKTPVRVDERPASSIYFRALVIASINPKSVAGYLAAFSQFVQPDVAIWDQMVVIVPTALTITALSYAGFTALGAAIGRAALGAVFNVWVRRILATCFIIYGLLLGSVAGPGRA